MGKIGYLGTGPLAAILVRRLRESHQLVSLHSTAAAPLTECGVVVIDLHSDSEVDKALFGNGGLAERLARGTIVIDHTPGDPDEARRRSEILRAHAIPLVDALIHCERFDTFPDGAAILCGGPTEAVDSVRNMLESLCPKVIHCGDSGSGRTAKLVVSAVAACNRMVTYESATIGMKSGLSLADMATVLDASSGYNSAIARVLPALEAGDRTSDVDLATAVSELKLAAELGKRCAAPMLVANLVSSMYEGAAAVLGNDATIDAMARIYEASAGITFASPSK